MSTGFVNIRKRDGRTVLFDAGKIRTAIWKAGEASGEFGETEAQALTLRVLAVASAALVSDTPSVERIQDVVEQVLLSSPWTASAKAFLLHRERHGQLRRIGARFQEGLVDDYLSRSDWQVSENANMAWSLQGLNNYVASEVTKAYWLEKIYPEDIRKAHREGDFHIHDLNLLAVYCVGWDLAGLLSDGFRGAVGKVESAPAKHFRTALGQIVNFFYTLQGEAAGAQAFSSLDTYLAPFIRADGLGYEEVKQALQEFVFNLNVPTRVGFQTPFTNVTLDWNVPAMLRDEAVIVGGKRRDTCYGDYQAEMDLFNRAFLEVLCEGDARGRVFTFPIPTYNISKDFDWDDSRLAPLWRTTARYGIPYFANFVNSDLDPEDARSMCCRLRLDTRELRKRGGGLFGANPLTGSIGVVTLNLPRLGFVCEDEEQFLSKLNGLMDLAARSLETKRKLLERLTDQGLYPYARFYLRDVKARTGKHWANHFSTIGLLGMEEACRNLLGCGLADAPGREFGLRVLSHMRERLLRYQEEYGSVWNLEATPAEGTSYRLALLDHRLYPGLRPANPEAVAEGAQPYYTNSSQLPVGFGSDPFAVLDHQDEFQASYTGGTVVHLFAGEAMADPCAVRELVRTVCQNYRLPYFTFTPTFSICPSHGYQSGEHPTCPECGAESEVYSRVVGYLRPVSQWNSGKQAEFADRVTFAFEGAPACA